MAQPRPLPRTGAVFLDPRGEDRSLRVSWHPEADVVVLSLWRDNLCAGTFRLAVDEVPDLIDLLRTGLAVNEPPLQIYRPLAQRPHVNRINR